jgi:hypothetical protein
MGESSSIITQTLPNQSFRDSSQQEGRLESMEALAKARNTFQALAAALNSELLNRKGANQDQNQILTTLQPQPA